MTQHTFPQQIDACYARLRASVASKPSTIFDLCNAHIYHLSPFGFNTTSFLAPLLCVWYIRRLSCLSTALLSCCYAAIGLLPMVYGLLSTVDCPPFQRTSVYCLVFNKCTTKTATAYTSAGNTPYAYMYVLYVRMCICMPILACLWVSVSAARLGVDEVYSDILLSFFYLYIYLAILLSGRQAILADKWCNGPEKCSC